jgi:hypothetical protein
MPTPHDAARTAAIRKWIAHVGGIDAAVEETGIGRRSIERMNAGTQPPPNRLLDRLAAQLADEGTNPALAAQLASAAADRETQSA